MRSRALWRPRADDPRTFLGWLARDGTRPVVTLSRSLEVGLRLVAICMLFQFGWPEAVCFFLLSFIPDLAGRVVLGIAKLAGTPMDARIRPLLTIPSPATPFPCLVEVSKGTTALGQDLGVVTFIEGWLHFEGNHTSFSLRPVDVRRRHGKQLVLAEGGRVEFMPEDRLRVEGLSERGLSERFAADLRNWERTRSPSGDPILPPAAVHDSGVARSLIDFGVSAIALALILAFLQGWWLGFLALPFGLELLRAIGNLIQTYRIGSSQRALPLVE